MSALYRIKVLYIEDNLSNRMLVKRVLEAHGRYDFIEAEDGVSGILMAQRELPDIIILDINIPGMDGYEVATRLKSLPALRDTPIVALTAKTLRGDRERALSAGCDGYIQKPFNIDTFPVEINEFLRGKRELLAATEEQKYLREHSQRFAERLEEKIAELTRVNQDLRETDRLKSKFIALAAHELRTPLTVIQGYLGILQNSTSGSIKLGVPETANVVNGIDKGVKRLAGIVSNMIDVTRIEAGNLQLNTSSISAAEVIKAVVHDLTSAAQERGHTLSVLGLESIPRIWADNKRLYQVLVNIVGNAIKYTPDGGQITIAASLKSGSEPGALHPKILDRNTDYLDIVVQDTGIGIAEADCERIFQRFYEVRDDALHSTSQHQFLGGGIGLGLAIARGIVEAHGGWVWAESTGSDLVTCPGSRFHVLMPVNRTQPASNHGVIRA